LDGKHEMTTIITLLFLLISPFVHGSNWYVSTIGSDTNNGSSSNTPFATIQKGARSASPGDTVLVFPGIYDEYASITNQGVRVKALGAVTNRSTFLIKAPSVTLDGFQLTIDGSYVNRAGIWLWYNSASNCSIINNYIHDTAIGYGIYCESTSSLNDPTNVPRSCIISNNIISNVAYGSMMTIAGDNHLIISNRFIDSNSHDGIDMFGVSNVVRGNYFRNISQKDGVGDHPDVIQTWGFNGLPAKYIIFENNWMQDCNCQICQMEQNLNTNVTDWVFRNNVYIRQGLQASIDVPGVVFYNNLFYQCVTNNHVLIYAFYPDGTNASVNRGSAYRGSVKNNVFLGCGPSKYSGWYIQSAASGYTPSPAMDLLDNSDYNYVGNIDGTAKATGARSDYVFSETNGINGGNVFFADASSLDFHLVSNSVLINKGVALSGSTNDIEGNKRPSGAAWEIGPYEYLGNPSITITSPTNNALYSTGAVSFAASVTDGSGSVTNVTWYTNGVSAGSATNLSLALVGYSTNTVYAAASANDGKTGYSLTNTFVIYPPLEVPTNFICR